MALQLFYFLLVGMEKNINSFPISFELHNNLTHSTKNHKSKQATTVTNRKQQINSRNSKSNHLFTKSKSHTRQSSHLRKSKSKCDTQVNLSAKKKKTQYESISKKTIPKKKKPNILIKSSFEANIDPSRAPANKKDQQLNIKSSNRKQKVSKQMFHSTCFSGHYDIDEGVSPGTSDILLGSDIVYENKETMISKVFEKTKCVLEQYRQKCDILGKNCKYYESQLNKALSQIKEMKRGEIQNKSYMKNSESGRRTNSLNKSRYKNRTKTTKGSRSKNSAGKEYGLTFHRNNSELLT